MIVVAGDIHLAYNTWARFPEMVGDSYVGLEQVVEFCVQNKSHLVLAGDVFDAKKLDSTTVRAFLRAMDRLSDNGLKAYAIQGQHDRTDPPWTTLHPAVHYMNEQSALIENRSWYFMDYQDKDSIQAAIARIPEGTEVVVMHQSLKQALPFEKDGAPCWDMELAQLPPSVRYAFFGDIHRIMDMRMAQGSAHYTGTVCMQATDEDPDKSFLSVSTGNDTQASLVVSRVPLKTRQFAKYSVVNDQTLDSVSDTILKLPDRVDVPDSIRKPFVMIFYQTDVLGVREKLNSVCEQRGVHKLMVPVSPEMVINGKIDTDIKLDDVSLEACLALEVNKDTDAELYAFTMSLLRAENNSEIQGIFERKRMELGVVLT